MVSVPLRLSRVFFESSVAFDEIRVLADGFNGGWGLDDITLAGKAVPEPATLALVGLGVLLVVRKRRKKQSA